MASLNSVARRILPLIDLTSLNSADTDKKIIALCQKAQSLTPPIAAVCIYPRFVRLASKLLPSVKVATVANFPDGNESEEKILGTITKSILDGAQEIDLVFPYQQYLKGDIQAATELIQHCKKQCGPAVLLKVILETGVLQSEEIIKEASKLAIFNGADFIKTSTGKVPVGATLEAAAVMLSVIKELTGSVGRPVGFKVSGGIRTLNQAVPYLELADQIMGTDWVTPKTFRFGTSQLVDEF